MPLYKKSFFKSNFTTKNEINRKRKFKAPVLTKENIELFLNENTSSDTAKSMEIPKKTNSNVFAAKTFAYGNRNEILPETLKESDSGISTERKLSQELMEKAIPLSQRSSLSSVSMNNPVIKNAYIKFSQQEKSELKFKFDKSLSEISIDLMNNNENEGTKNMKTCTKKIKEIKPEKCKKIPKKHEIKLVEKHAHSQLEKPISNENLVAKKEKKILAQKVTNKKKQKSDKKEKQNESLEKQSQLSMNQPIVKDAYLSFMKKNTKQLSNPPETRDHREKMLWLQDQRNVGLYVFCDSCDKIRYLEDCKDPLDLPAEWYCHMNPDVNFNRCSTPEEEIPAGIEADLIENLYNAGSIVWAKIDGFPWWPAMVDDDPDTERYYWLEGLSDVPTWYHVTFFDTKDVTRSWLRPHEIKPFKVNMTNPLYLPSKFDKYKRRVDASFKQAQHATSLDLSDRLKKYSFLSCYHGPIHKPIYESESNINLTDNNSKQKKLVSKSLTKSEKARKIKKEGKKKQKNFIDLNKVTKKSSYAKILSDEFSDDGINAVITEILSNECDDGPSPDLFTDMNFAFE